MHENQQYKPRDKIQEKPLEKTSKKPSQKPLEKSSEKSSEKPSEKSSEKLSEKPSENSSGNPSEKPSEKSSEAPSEKPSKKHKKKSKNKSKEKSKEKQKEKPVIKSEEPTKSKEELGQGPLARADASMIADFEKWCIDILSPWSSKIDVPTFYGFIKDIEPPYEVKEYVKHYLGDSKKSKEFSRHFLARRSKLLRESMAAPSDDLCKPAVALNPRIISKSDYQEPKRKHKKSKKKMHKVDLCSKDDINVGDIDSISSPPKPRVCQSSNCVTPPEGDAIAISPLE